MVDLPVEQGGGGARAPPTAPRTVEPPLDFAGHGSVIWVRWWLKTMKKSCLSTNWALTSLNMQHQPDSP